MKWILQNNIYEEEGYARIVSAIERRGLPLTHVKVIPFGGGMELVDGSLPADDEKAIVMGSYSLTNYAKQLGWKPGAFMDNLDFEIQRDKWGDLMLNADARVSPFWDVHYFSEPSFIRPVYDTKSFTGTVMDWGQFKEWKDKVDEMWFQGMLVEGDLLIPDTPVMVGRKKEIYSETRTWVIPGGSGHGFRMSCTPVVTCSGYKVGTLKRYSEPWEVDLRILEFVDRVCSRWHPNEAFVLDVADTPNGLRIVEVNNLNSAGFYRADMGRLVEALEERFGP